MTSNNLCFQASRLREAISSKKTTQTALAHEMGVKPQTISSYCNGRSPELENLIKLSQALEVSIDWLCGLTDVNVNDSATNVCIPYSEYLQGWYLAQCYCSIDFNNVLLNHEKFCSKSLGEFYIQMKAIAQMRKEKILDPAVCQSAIDKLIAKYAPLYENDIKIFSSASMVDEIMNGELPF